MPNWIEGTMKLRGKRDDISRFIHEGIHGYDFLGENERPKNVNLIYRFNFEFSTAVDKRLVDQIDQIGGKNDET